MSGRDADAADEQGDPRHGTHDQLEGHHEGVELVDGGLHGVDPDRILAALVGDALDFGELLDGLLLHGLDVCALAGKAHDAR